MFNTRSTDDKDAEIAVLDRRTGGDVRDGCGAQVIGMKTMIRRMRMTVESSPVFSRSVPSISSWNW